MLDLSQEMLQLHVKKYIKMEEPIAIGMNGWNPGMPEQWAS